MNQPIRCEPLPFVRPNGEAAAEAPLCTEENGSEFSALLNAELNVPADASEESAEDQTPDEIEAVAVYGVAPVLLQLLPQELPLLSAETSAGSSASSNQQGASPVLTEEGALLENVADSASPAKPPSNALSPPAESVNPANLKPFAEQKAALPEQKVPSQPKIVAPALEHIASKGPEPAKNSSGMLVAQGPSMLMTSQRQNETVPHAEQPLGLEGFEAASFEQPIRVQPIQSKASPPKTTDFSEITGVASETNAPRFEAVAGEIDLQPVRPLEPATVVDAIRTHVELLKSSTTEKLDVVIRPDAQTELHLQVEKVNGQVQVQARCDRGDFTALETHWSTIQNTLGSQGIRVEPLQQGSGAQLQQNGAHTSQNSPGRHSNDREERPAHFIEQELTNRQATRPKASRGSAARGWQSWA
jgi:hypothetical protein